MPSERFLNLPEEKRVRILEAAIAEITRVPYDKVSINKIVSAARIPRGSFYQYFDGKQDLLKHVLDIFAQRVMSTCEEALKAAGGNIFAVLPIVLQQIIEMGERFNNPIFFRNVFSSQGMQQLKVFTMSREDIIGVVSRFENVADDSIFGDMPCESRLDIIEISIILLHNAIVRYFVDEAGSEDVLSEFERRLRIIKNSVLVKGANSNGKI